MIFAMELVKEKQNKKRFPWEQRTGFQVYKEALKKGVLLRPLGDVIYFMPPYVVGDREIHIMIDTACKAINKVLGGLNGN
jgi:adenosylmethionine-8-amino-7-oxononanoate aminotransferase